MRITIAALAVLALGAGLSASTTVPTSLRDLVTGATVIVRGHVTDVRAVVAPTGEIDSIVTVAVVSVLKGTADDFVSVRVPGGTIGRDRVTVVGAPTLFTGDDAVWFLARGSFDSWWPVGLAMGVYRVRPNPQTGVPSVAPPIVLGVTAAAGPILRGVSTRQPMAAEEFQSLVQLIISGAGGGPPGSSPPRTGPGVGGAGMAGGRGGAIR